MGTEQVTRPKTLQAVWWWWWWWWWRRRWWWWRCTEWPRSAPLLYTVQMTKITVQTVNSLCCQQLQVVLMQTGCFMSSPWTQRLSWDVLTYMFPLQWISYVHGHDHMGTVETDLQATPSKWILRFSQWWWWGSMASILEMWKVMLFQKIYNCLPADTVKLNVNISGSTADGSWVSQRKQRNKST